MAENLNLSTFLYSNPFVYFTGEVDCIVTYTAILFGNLLVKLFDWNIYKFLGY
jgi:hypothetical protein